MVAAGVFDDVPAEQRKRTVEYEGHLYATLDFVDPDSTTLGPTKLPECVSIPPGWEISSDEAAIAEAVVGKHPWGTKLLVTRSGAGFTTRLYTGQPGSKIGNYELMSIDDDLYGPRRCLPSRPSRILIRYPAGIDPNLPKLVAGPPTKIKGQLFGQVTTVGPIVWAGKTSRQAAVTALPAQSAGPDDPWASYVESGSAQADPLQIGLLFPGQGSHYVGMLQHVKDLPRVKDMLAKAEPILGFDVLRVCGEGPFDKLEETHICQPIMFIAGLAGLEKLRNEREEAVTRPRFMAGYSLGEYTALCAAGVFDFEDGLRLVKLRGQAMHDASEVAKQRMASIIGLGKEEVEGLCKQAREKEGPGAACQISTICFPNGFTCGGSEIAINELQKLAEDKGATQAKVLGTSCAFHTTLMQPAQDELSEKLDETLPRMNSPSCTVYMNATSKPIVPGTDPREIIENLKKHLTSCALWAPLVSAMIAEGVTEYYEVGPQKQLKAMMKRIDAEAWKTTTNVEV